MAKTGRRKISLTNESSIMIGVRVPRSWVRALKKLETEDFKQPQLVRSAIRRFLRAKKVLAG